VTGQPADARPSRRPFRRRELGETTALLVAACQRKPDPRELSAHARQLARADAYDRFVEVADRHGVLGLALSTLDRAGALTRDDAAAPLQATLHGLRRRAALLALERENVLRTLAQHDVSAVVLKGAGLSATVYSTPVERNYGDIDLLLSPDAIPAALDALARAGYHASGSDAVVAAYREHHFHYRVQRGRGMIVELHWALTAAREPYHLDESAFLAQSRIARRYDADGENESLARSFRVPRPEHALMHIVVENVRDGFSRLTRIVDVDRIVGAAPDIDWALVQSTARDGRLAPALALALDVSGTLFGTVVPAEVTRALRPTRAVRLHLSLLRPVPSLLRQRATTRTTWIALLQFWLLSGQSRRSAIARMLRGDDADPLAWIWNGEDEGAPVRPRLRDRLLRAQKMALYQLAIYAAALAPSDAGIRRLSTRSASPRAPARGRATEPA